MPTEKGAACEIRAECNEKGIRVHTTNKQLQDIIRKLNVIFWYLYE